MIKRCVVGRWVIKRCVIERWAIFNYAWPMTCGRCDLCGECAVRDMAVWDDSDILR